MHRHAPACTAMHRHAPAYLYCPFSYSSIQYFIHSSIEVFNVHSWTQLTVLFLLHLQFVSQFHNFFLKSGQFQCTLTLLLGPFICQSGQSRVDQGHLADLLLQFEDPSNICKVQHSSQPGRSSESHKKQFGFVGRLYNTVFEANLQRMEIEMYFLIESCRRKRRNPFETKRLVYYT